MEELLLARLFCERMAPLNGAIWVNTNRSDLSAVTVKLPSPGMHARWITGAGERKGWRKKRLLSCFTFPSLPSCARPMQEKRDDQTRDETVYEKLFVISGFTSTHVQELGFRCCGLEISINLYHFRHFSLSFFRQYAIN